MSRPPGASEAGPSARLRRRPARRRGRLLLSATLILSGAATSAAPDDRLGPTEYEIKAAFLLNFARFVEWPADALPAAAPIVFAVLGEDPFGPQLEETLRGQSVAGHSLAIRRLRDLEDLTRTQVLFVAASEDERLARILERLADVPVLVVGETPGFAARGGIIGFRLEGNRVRFDVNLAAAERSGVRLSSRLLRLARIVREPAGEATR
jgi:hypothetical protein